jgi:CRP-like cAMP-binding protein
MKFGSGGRRRRPGRMRRFAAVHPMSVLLLCAVLAAVAAVVLLAVGPGAGRVVLVLALLAGLGLCTHRCVRAVRRRARSSHSDASVQSTNPPIEEIAADLRRMLWRHDVFARSNDSPSPAGRLRALENRITQRAVEAARALEVTHPDPPAYGGFTTTQLRRLLHDLRAEGLVLPAEVGLMTPDSRF